MIIAAYNLRAGGKRGERVHWQRLLDDYAPHPPLMQETHHPPDYLPPALYAANAWPRAARCGSITRSAPRAARSTKPGAKRRAHDLRRQLPYRQPLLQ